MCASLWHKSQTNSCSSPHRFSRLQRFHAAPCSATTTVLAKRCTTVLTSMAGGRRYGIAPVTPASHCVAYILLRRPWFQRPLTVVFGQPVDFRVGCQIQNQTVVAIFLWTQASAHHLQVKRQTLGRTGYDHTGGIRQIKSLGGNCNVDENS